VLANPPYNYYGKCTYPDKSLSHAFFYGGKQAEWVGWLVVCHGPRASVKKEGRRVERKFNRVGHGTYSTHKHVSRAPTSRFEPPDVTKWLRPPDVTKFTKMAKKIFEK
jgi:hypothetical protein